MKSGHYETAKGNSLRVERGMNNYGQWENTIYDDRGRILRRETYNSAWDMEAAYCPMTNWARINY